MTNPIYSSRVFLKAIPSVLVGALFILGNCLAADKAATDQTGKADKDMTVDQLIQKGAKYVGSDDCATCHEKQEKEYRLSTHSRISVKEGEIKGCEMCHGPGSLHVDAGGGIGVDIVNPKKDPNACFACHTEKKLEFRLPYHHPVLEGKISCVDCHSAHGIDARPGKVTSFDSVNGLCFKCHKDKRGPFVMEHEAMREGCTVCHKVHGSINDKMLVTRDNNLCLRCHTQVAFPTIGSSGHQGRLFSGTCYSADCHQGVHGSNFDDHLRE